TEGEGTTRSTKGARTGLNSLRLLCFLWFLPPLWFSMSFRMSNDLEIKLLKETVLALRDELEKAGFEERDHIEQAVSGAHAEIRQLRSSVAGLREQLELKQAEYEDNVRSMELQHHRDKADLQKTVAALRQELEELNESLKTQGSPTKATAPSSR